MQRREFLATVSASLGALHDRIEAATPAGATKIKWAVSMFLWTSTQWGDRAPVPFTDMLDSRQGHRFRWVPVCGMAGFAPEIRSDDPFSRKRTVQTQPPYRHNVLRRA